MRTETPLMPGGLLLQLCSEQARALFGWFYQGPTQARFDPRWLAEMVQAFVAHVELLNRADRALWLQAAGGDYLNYVDADYVMLGLIESALTQGRHLKEALDRVAQGGPMPNGTGARGATRVAPQGPGVKVVGTEELDRALALLEQLPEVHRKSWPRANPPTWEEAEAAYRRGEFQDLEDAVAQLAGTNREDWRQRAEAHKSRKELGGGQ
jgi:hypothetical protein